MEKYNFSAETTYLGGITCYKRVYIRYFLRIIYKIFVYKISECNSLLAMKRNITVFILLILIASSFKYRTKARESNLPLGAAKVAANVLPDTLAFEATVSKLQKANYEMANGNPELFKSMWSRSSEVTIFGESQSKELKGWQAVEASLNETKRVFAKKNAYTFERISGNESGDQAYLLQEEHYKLANGETRDLQVTILFHKENNVWKIVHRHADNLSVRKESDRTSK